MNAPTLTRPLLLLALLAAFLSAPRPASAQLTRIDTAAVLLAAAQDFDGRGESEVAAALYRHIAERFAGTTAAEFARGRLRGVTTRRSQAGGDVELTVWSALYGIWQGIAVPVAADADELESYGVGLLVGGSAGLLVGRHMARSRPRTLGQARAITWGGTWGTIQGWGWASALDLGNDRVAYVDAEGDTYYEDEETTRAVFASMIVGGAAGIAGGLVWARREITPGTATSAMLGSLWGTWLGYSTAFLMDVEGDWLTAASMLAGNVGLVAGALTGSRLPLSRGRARMISVGGLVGAVGGAGITLITQPDEPKAAMATILATSIAGLAVAAANTGGDWDESDASDGLEATSLPAPGALLNWSDGDWAFSTPLPTPALKPASRRGDGDGLTWKVPLLNISF